MSNLCETCRSPQAPLTCGICENALCKKCALTPPQGAFRLMAKVPAELQHRHYCRFCFDEKVQAPLAAYEETEAAANEVFIFFKTQRKEIPLIRKSKEMLKVDDCDDRDETILRLAFQAAERKFNAVIETEALSEKIRNHAHHTHRWKGTGYPALIDGAKLDRQARMNSMFERG